MNYDEILRRVLRRYAIKTDQIRTIQIIESKLKRHKATYIDAENYAQEIGKSLTEVLREYLPEALTDGKLYRAAAEILIENPLKKAGKDVSKVAAEIQRQLNQDAGIGMNAIIPDLNQDQIDGIVTGICNATSYADNVDQLMDQVENFLEGHVDDFVRENADFQSEAGLTVVVQRIADAKCCKWCSNLAGTYDYFEVKDRGNDVWRRHNNCHCQIIYDPSGSKRRR